MKQIPTYWYISAIMTLSPLCAPAQSGDVVTVALIADKAYDLHKSPLISLIEAELSQRDGVILLERAQIDKILREQELSAAGLLDRSSAIKVGRLLRADAFLL
ncbi:MAG: CsgG/HfaB family protein, partial [Planctomycetota bacterium]